METTEREEKIFIFNVFSTRKKNENKLLSCDDEKGQVLSKLSFRSTRKKIETK